MFIHWLILITAYTVQVSSSAQKEYGTFNLTITQFDICKGPKQKDCAHSTASISNTSTSLIYEIDVLQNVSPTKGKIVAVTNSKEFLRLQVKKPCEHLFLRPLFSSLMNVTKDCYVVKGHYKFQVDILAIAQSYFGGTFVFGNWTFKSLFYNDACNFSCANIQVVMSPKKEH
ncbi:uncharacterized protein LOC118265492 [Spodoptera frugiperda]|uniref:Uncharacterized protein LOC118265492 n=2 Tax=Spodoptera frugiperda TaxID=7108 RepID=A0A9R0CYX0_SPOFR|nr:uncharacterized protein LOC118265492 [Spodoptera frugiperda]